MKFILSVIFLFCLCANIKSQTLFIDSLKDINNELDKRIMSIFNKADSLGQDILIVRKYDSLNNILRDNYCSVMQKEDTCSISYILDVEENFTISYCPSSKIKRSSEFPNCENDFPKIYRLLSEDFGDHQSYFTDTVPTSIDFSKSDYTLIGRINGQYIFEVFDNNFVEEFHSGLLHHVVTGYMGIIKLN